VEPNEPRHFGGIPLQAANARHACDLEPTNL